MSITTTPSALNECPHPFSHLPTYYWLTNPLAENQLFHKGWDKAMIEAMADEELAALMKEEGCSHEWMQYLSQTRILTLLRDRFSEIMSHNFHPVEERIRIRLACLILKEQLSPVPFYAAKEAKWGESYWIIYQSGCYNE